MININWKGRFGNNLFQISAANFLAKKHNQEINTSWNKLIKKHETKDTCKNKEEIIVTDKNIEEIFNKDSIDCNFVLDDFFQTRFCISRFIKDNEYFNPVEPIIDATFVHVRLDDIKDTMSVSYDYYDEALANTDNKNIFISSDSPRDKIVQDLIKKYKATIFIDNEENTVAFGANCKNKVLSMGTFSWWIGYLGSYFLKNQNGTTFCPKKDRSIVWHGDIFPLFDWRQI